MTSPELSITASAAFRATIVRESLRHLCSPCAGFMLGRYSPETGSARFDFALAAITFPDYFGANEGKLKVLPRFLHAADATAKAFDRVLMGLWAAWDNPWQVGDIREERHETLVMQSRGINLPFVATMSICAREPMWPVLFWQCDRLPHAPLYASKARVVRIEGPQDNPRRVKAAWRKQLASKNLPIP